jgi:Tol biopolymer transport system component
LHVRVGFALVVALVCFALAASVAEASFPGKNGLIAFARTGPHGEQTIWVINPRNGRRHELTHVSRGCAGNAQSWRDREPSFSASGDLIAYVHVDSCDRRTPTGIYVMRADGTRRRLVVPDPGWNRIVELPVFSPSGRRLAYDEFLVDETIITAMRGPGRFESRRALELSAFPFRFDSIVQPAWSPAGKLAVTVSGRFGLDRGHIATVAADGDGPVRLVTRSRRDAMPNWSPKGNRIAFHRLTQRRRGELGGNLFVAQASGNAGRPRRLTKSLDAFFPAWSPDGRYIAYVRDQDFSEFDENPNGSLWLMAASSGRPRRPLATNIYADQISWQPRPR